MSEAIPAELKKSIREVLGEALNIEVSFTSDFTRSKFDSQKRLAADHLIDLGVLQVSGPDYRTTDMLRVTAILLQAAGRGWLSPTHTASVSRDSPLGTPLCNLGRSFPNHTSASPAPYSSLCWYTSPLHSCWSASR